MERNKNKNPLVNTEKPPFLKQMSSYRKFAVKLSHQADLDIFNTDDYHSSVNRSVFSITVFSQIYKYLPIFCLCS